MVWGVRVISDRRKDRILTKLARGRDEPIPGQPVGAVVGSMADATSKWIGSQSPEVKSYRSATQTRVPLDDYTDAYQKRFPLTSGPSISSPDSPPENSSLGRAGRAVNWESDQIKRENDAVKSQLGTLDRRWAPLLDPSKYSPETGHKWDGSRSTEPPLYMRRQDQKEARKLPSMPWVENVAGVRNSPLVPPVTGLRGETVRLDTNSPVGPHGRNMGAVAGPPTLNAMRDQYRALQAPLLAREAETQRQQATLNKAIDDSMGVIEARAVGEQSPFVSGSLPKRALLRLQQRFFPEKSPEEVAREESERAAYRRDQGGSIDFIKRRLGFPETTIRKDRIMREAQRASGDPPLLDTLTNLGRYGDLSAIPQLMSAPIDAAGTHAEAIARKAVSDWADRKPVSYDEAYLQTLRERGRMRGNMQDLQVRMRLGLPVGPADVVPVPGVAPMSDALMGVALPEFKGTGAASGLANLYMQGVSPMMGGRLGLTRLSLPMPGETRRQFLAGQGVGLAAGYALPPKDEYTGQMTRDRAASNYDQYSGQLREVEQEGKGFQRFRRPQATQPTTTWSRGSY